MKKKLLVLLLSAISLTSAFATQLYVTRCGIKVYTVDETYFTSLDDRADYYAELDDIYCPLY